VELWTFQSGTNRLRIVICQLLRHLLQRFLPLLDQLVALSRADDEHLIAVAADELPLLATFLVQPVHFDEGDADRVVLAAHDRGVTSWRECTHDGALPIITGR